MEKNRLVFIFGAVLLCALIGLAVFFGLSDDVVDKPLPAKPQAAATPPSKPLVSEVESSKPSGNFEVSGVAQSASDFSSNPPRTSEEDNIIKLASADQMDRTARAERLLQMAAGAQDPDAKQMAVEYAAELIRDNSYLNYRGQMFQIANTPELREVVMDDALTRGEDVRLPTLVEMLKLPLTEAERSDIREVLEAYVDKDYGPDAGAWEAPVQQWVKENTQQ